MRKAVFTSAFLAALLVAATSRANLIYDFHETSATGFLATLPASAYAPQLVVSDTAPATGIDFTRTCAISAPASCTTTGSMNGFVSLTDASPNFGTLSLDLAFAPDGTLAGSMFERGFNEDLNADGNQFNWSGTLLSDHFPGCGAAAPCTVAGYWLEAGGPETDVPEPSALLLFATGFGALLVVAYRHRA